MPPRRARSVRRAEVHLTPRIMLEQAKKTALAGMRDAMMIAEKEAKRLVSRTQPLHVTASGTLIGLDPSKPGEPPKIVTKELLNGIESGAKTEGDNVVGWLGVVGPADKYALRLERGFIGADSKGRVYRDLPRPFLSLAITSKRRNMKRAIGTGRSLTRRSL